MFNIVIQKLRFIFFIDLFKCAALNDQLVLSSACAQTCKETLVAYSEVFNEVFY